MSLARTNIGLLAGIFISWTLAACTSDATEPQPSEEENVASTSQAQQKGTGGGSTSPACVADLQDCYIGCAVS